MIEIAINMIFFRPFDTTLNGFINKNIIAGSKTVSACHVFKITNFIIQSPGFAIRCRNDINTIFCQCFCIVRKIWEASDTFPEDTEFFFFAKSRSTVLAVFIDLKEKLLEYICSFFFSTCKYHTTHVVEEVKTA